jgi:hypothetical protein
MAIPLSLLNIDFLNRELPPGFAERRADKPAMICEIGVSDVRKCWLRRASAALDKVEGCDCHDPV